MLHHHNGYVRNADGRLVSTPAELVQRRPPDPIALPDESRPLAWRVVGAAFVLVTLVCLVGLVVGALALGGVL
jgi:hypothetical protein